MGSSRANDHVLVTSDRVEGRGGAWGEKSETCCKRKSLDQRNESLFPV
jgi:hypothetical protein